MSTSILRLIAVVVAAAGLGVLLASPSLGEAAGLAILARHGGSMDTNEYLSLMQAAITGYRLVGAILLGVGLFRALEVH